MKGNERSLRLAEADGWEVHEVAKAPATNSPEDIRQSMDLLQQIHRDSLRSNEPVDLDRMEVFIASELEYAHYQRVKPMLAELRQLRVACSAHETSEPSWVAAADRLLERVAHASGIEAERRALIALMPSPEEPPGQETTTDA